MAPDVHFVRNVACVREYRIAFPLSIYSYLSLTRVSHVSHEHETGDLFRPLRYFVRAMPDNLSESLAGVAKTALPHAPASQKAPR